MGKRSTGRKLAMQALYQCDIRDLDVTTVINDFIEPSELPEDTKEWATYLIKDAWDYRTEADQIVQKYSIGWDLKRINLVDKALLRLALFEMKHAETPASVVINEVIELSKKFSTDESPKFINGILGNYVKKECLPELSKNLE